MTAQLIDIAKQEDAESLLEAGRGSGDTDCLSISRHDIDFFNVAPRRVAVEIRVRNVADEASAAATLTLRAAPFGAFVPWQPLAVLPVPPLAPGRVCYLRTGVHTGNLQPLGRADRIPPRQLLTALGLADEPPRQPTTPKASIPRKAPAPPPPGPGTMPADLLQLLLQGTPHWIGNLNVLVGKTDVERHHARALRVYPGRANMAWFVVGARGRDAYTFHLSGCGNDWDAKLFDMTTRETLVPDMTQTPAIPPERWIQTDGPRTMLLALRPPRDCTAGAIEVHVRQHSTGRTAVVEFSLDPNAEGRGCFTV